MGCQNIIPKQVEATAQMETEFLRVAASMGFSKVETLPSKARQEGRPTGQAALGAAPKPHHEERRHFRWIFPESLEKKRNRNFKKPWKKKTWKATAGTTAAVTTATVTTVTASTAAVRTTVVIFCGGYGNCCDDGGGYDCCCGTVTRTGTLS